ncbi:MAG: hypothetical protein PHN29_06475, partial [Endomicrobiaceae bacterium]|nr:hypothetical protein [Endomicrobiaceae bacterium]
MRRILGFLLLLVFLFALGFMVAEVKAETGSQPIKITYIYDEYNIFEMSDTAQYGSGYTHTFSPSADYTFAYWVVNGAIRKDLAADYSFTVTTDMRLQAVFSPKDKHTVLFIDSNGAVIDIQFVLNGASATEPMTLPNKPGLKIAETDKWSPVSLENITANTVFVLQYEVEKSDTYTLTVDDVAHGTYNYNQLAEVTADAQKAGVNFSHWEENGQTLSYDFTYAFTVLSDRALNAVYNNDTTVSPLVSISDALELREGYFTFVGQAYLPAAGFEFIESGFLLSKENVTLEKGNVGVTTVQHPKLHDQTNEFVMSFPANSLKYIRAYLTVKSGETYTTYYSGKTVTLPTDRPELTLASPAFAIDTAEDLVYSVDLKGGTLSGITY